MGFCDPCPGEAKQLKVAYTYLGHQYEVCFVVRYCKLQNVHRALSNISFRRPFLSGAPSCGERMKPSFFLGVLETGLCSHQYL